ncbi:unnamed protein product [Oikopleura dioica]|uniref:SH3 domain-containing protein n=1 Tax=Oikopleura dioica TaxID=34765 RepID=E4XVB6_OIKDI|nr:unnamed protein product [Oikopleura dioica]
MSIQTVAKKTLFVKALFDYDATLDSGLPSKGLSFKYGDIIHVTNATDPEWWQAQIVVNSSDGSGIIPSKHRVMRKERKRINQVKFNSTPKSLEFFSIYEECQSQKEAQETTKSLNSTDQQDEWILSYEPVTQQKIDYVRPIVILGPMKDRILEDLIQDQPQKFGVCIPHTTRAPRANEVHGALGSYYFIAMEEMKRQKDLGLFFEVGIHNENLYGTSINSVKAVSSKGLHCVLDVRGDAIPELQKKSIYPIAIYIKPKLSELNKRLTHDACIKIIQQGERVSAEFADCFTASVTGDTIEEIEESVLHVIKLHGGSEPWLPSGEMIP